MCQVPMFMAACQEPDAVGATPGHKGQLILEWIRGLGFLGLLGAWSCQGPLKLAGTSRHQSEPEA